MNLNRARVYVLCAAMAFATACGGVQIATPKHAEGEHAALGENKVSSVTVTSSSELEGDKQKLITKNDVPNKLTAALTDSLKSGGHVDAAGTLKVTVNITEMRLPSNPGLGGGDLIGGTVTVTDASGTEVKKFDAQGSSVKGMFVNKGRTSRFGTVLNQFAQNIVDGL
jgi:hypothetical protein